MKDILNIICIYFDITNDDNVLIVSELQNVKLPKYFMKWPALPGEPWIWSYWLLNTKIEFQKKIKTSNFGTIYHTFVNNKRHSLNGLPAIYGNIREWYKDGQLHRENCMPAVEYTKNPLRLYFLNGLYAGHSNSLDNEYSFLKPGLCKCRYLWCKFYFEGMLESYKDVQDPHGPLSVDQNLFIDSNSVALEYKI